MESNADTKQKIIVTSALPYVNNTPHLGNVVGCVLSADVYARYMRKLRNREVLFIGGVDEYGTATEMKARELGITCKELCDRNYAIHKEAYDWFKIEFDCYGRTSQPNGDPAQTDLSWPHTRITHQIFQELVDSGYIIEQEEVTWYCEEIDAFVADRYIVSTCYHCQNEGADGDQCDVCGNLLSTEKLVNPRYKPNPEYQLIKKNTTNLYLDLPRVWQDYDMTSWFESNSDNWTDTARSITTNWTEKKGLLPRSISRDLKWGTRVPDTQEFGSAYSNKVFYVWFDAPIGYLSIMENELGEESTSWWNKNSELVQFMAKDNVPFHSIIFPSTLAPIQKSYPLPQKVTIASTDYLMYEGTKFSKSKNTGLFCDDVIRISEALNLGADLFRAYLIYVRPETSDSNFVLNENGLVDFHNNFLIKNLGNLCHRVRSIAFQFFKKHNQTIYHSGGPNGKIPSKLISDFKSDVKNILKQYYDHMDHIRLREGLKTVFELSTRCNVLINDVKPWEHTKLPAYAIPEIYFEFMTEIWKTLLTLGELIEPFMPDIGLQIQDDFEITTRKYEKKHEHDFDMPDSLAYKIPATKPKPMFKPLDYIDLSDFSK